MSSSAVVKPFHCQNAKCRGLSYFAFSQQILTDLSLLVIVEEVNICSCASLAISEVSYLFYNITYYHHILGTYISERWDNLILPNGMILEICKPYLKHAIYDNTLTPNLLCFDLTSLYGCLLPVP